MEEKITCAEYEFKNSKKLLLASLALLEDVDEGFIRDLDKQLHMTKFDQPGIRVDKAKYEKSLSEKQMKFILALHNLRSAASDLHDTAMRLKDSANRE